MRLSTLGVLPTRMGFRNGPVTLRDSPTRVGVDMRRNVCLDGDAARCRPGLRGRPPTTHFLRPSGSRRHDDHDGHPSRSAAGRAEIPAKTLRTDRWWFKPAYTVVGLSAWLIYGFVHVLMQKWYFAEGAGYSLPHAVLLAVRQRRLRPRGGALRPVRAGLAAGPVRAAEPAVPAAVPAHLLLLPAGVLPLVLALAAGLRGAGRPQDVHRRDPLPADLPEPAPVRVLRRRAHLADQHLRRGPRPSTAPRASASAWAT